MFSNDLRERLNLLDENIVKESNEVLHLLETSESGKADLEIVLQNQCIYFWDLENKKMQYFVCKKCADHVVFEKKADAWIIHIFEMKRTVKKDEWITIKEQFKGALQNSLALVGVLGINDEVKEIKLYTAFRNDKINNYSNTIQQRIQMHETKEKREQYVNDWNDEVISLNFLGVEKFLHIKIPLDIETGRGKYDLE